MNRAGYLLALHAIAGCDDDEKLDDIAALCEQMFEVPRRPWIVPPPALRALRDEVARKRKELAGEALVASREKP